jgi:hypothetical protein
MLPLSRNTEGRTRSASRDDYYSFPFVNSIASLPLEHENTSDRETRKLIRVNTMMKCLEKRHHEMKEERKETETTEIEPRKKDARRQRTRKQE